MRRAAVGLLAAACACGAAQIRPASPDTVSRAEVVQAARQALEASSRSFGHWLTIVIIAVLFGAALVVWMLRALSQRLSRLEGLRTAWDARFAGTTDEVLRLKRKLAEDESRAERLEIDIASLRPTEPDATTDQVAMVQADLAALRERLDRTDEKLDAVVDHTVVTKQERAAVEEMVRTAAQAQAATEETVRNAAQARAAAEAAAIRAEGVAKRIAAIDSLRVADEKLAERQYPAAVQAYTRCLESLEGGGVEDPGLRFHALHDRALANLRQREFDAVLADAAVIEGFASAGSGGADAVRAQGAARLLAGVARLWQGKVPQALQDLAAAVEGDEGARAALLQDEDIAAWVEVNSKKAGPVKRFIRDGAKGPKVQRAKTSSPESKPQP